MCFGFVQNKGHSYNKSFKEYSVSKRKVEDDFILKTAQTSYSEPKVRRKRYETPHKTNIASTKIIKVMDFVRNSRSPQTQFKLCNDIFRLKGDKLYLLEAQRIQAKAMTDQNERHQKDLLESQSTLSQRYVCKHACVCSVHVL